MAQVAPVKSAHRDRNKTKEGRVEGKAIMKEAKTGRDTVRKKGGAENQGLRWTLVSRKEMKQTLLASRSYHADSMTFVKNK